MTKKGLTEFKLPKRISKLPDGIALPFALPELTKEAALPMATSVGFGTLTGFSCGYSLKKVGRAAAGSSRVSSYYFRYAKEGHTEGVYAHIWGTKIRQRVGQWARG